MPFRKKLKALTISNEMLYDSTVVLCFKEVPGLQQALSNLRTVKDSGLSEPLATKTPFKYHCDV